MKTPEAQAQLQLVVSLASAGNRPAAVAEATRITDKHVASEAWRVLSELNANMQRWDAAEADLKIAMQHQPGSRVLKLRHALLREQRGDSAGALAELEALEREISDSPELLVHLARALQYAGDSARAEQKVTAALQRWPLDAALHRLLAELRWQGGAGSDATQALEAAIEAHPHEQRLRLVAADLLRQLGAESRALTLLERGLELAPDAPALLTSTGVLLDGLERPAEALPHLRAALVCAPTSVQARRNLIPTLLRTGAAAESLAIATNLVTQFPDDQWLLAWQSTAMRVLGDPRHATLCDYSRLVRCYDLAPPAEYPDAPAFNHAFESALSPLHRSARHPLAQSLRGGSQTGRNLPAEDPRVADFLSMIDAPIRDYISRLRQVPEHPADRRRRDAYRISGSWSVRLEAGGFHLNHVHPQGWLSSAYYVALPGTASTAGGRDGWLKFGEPGLAVPGCTPEHFVEPRPGRLVLFPSYFWHGTVPFPESPTGDGGRRLTAAFDVLPA